MTDIVAAFFARLAQREASKPVQLVLEQLGSVLSNEKMQAAVKANAEELLGHITSIAAVLEVEFRERTGRGFDESTEEELGRFHRALAGALMETYDEIAPERLRMLAAAVAGMAWGPDADGALRSAAWRAIKRIESSALVTLSVLCSDELREELGLSKLPDDEAVLDDDDKAWLPHLESLACVATSLRFLGTEFDGWGGQVIDGVPYAKNDLSYGPIGVERTSPRLTSVGETALRLLKPYVKDLVSEPHAPEPKGDPHG